MSLLSGGTSRISLFNLITTQKRFGNLPESLVENINQIDDIAVLENLIVEIISVNSPEDFQRLIDSQLSDNA